MSVVAKDRYEIVCAEGHRVAIRALTLSGTERWVQLWHEDERINRAAGEVLADYAPLDGVDEIVREINARLENSR